MTKTAYRADGAVHETTDANGRKTRLLYDDAGRVAARIANATGAGPPLGTAARDTDVYTRYVYGDGLLKKICVDLDGDVVLLPPRRVVADGASGSRARGLWRE